MRKFTLLFSWLLLLDIAGSVNAQDKNSLSSQDLEKYKQQVTSLVRYFESTINFLGDPKSIAKEKEIVINESYLKMFLNDKVQIEDDLDDNREVPLYKDVQAYLKDIGFFYRRVKFEFVVADITHFVNEKKVHYFKVTFNRLMNGLTVTGDSVSSRKIRYMEINLDVNASTLKIASIYTTKLDEKEEIKVWWNNLSYTWKGILGKDVFISDTIGLSQILFFSDSIAVVSLEANLNTTQPDSTLSYQISLPEDKELSSGNPMAMDTLNINTDEIFSKLKGILNQKQIDVSNRYEIKNISPLTEMTELRDINCANTLTVDLFPIRNLNHLEKLNCSETPVDNIQPLHYTTTLRELNCSYTLINDLEPISGLVNLEDLKCEGIKITSLEFIGNLKKLKSFDCSNTRIYDLSPLTGLKTIQNLDFSGTGITDLNVVSKLDSLVYLNCESTPVSSVESLTGLPKLEILRISNTEVKTLEPLKAIETLRRIYCDNTLIPKNEAIQFMRENPECLVIFESEDLLAGWNQLEKPWKDIVSKNAEISETPTKEELHKVITIDKLDISGNKEITTLNPIRRLFNLEILNVSSTNLKDFTPIADVLELENLNLSNNSVSSIDFLAKCLRLQTLNIERTSVSSLKPVEGISNLRLIYADHSGITDKEAFNFRKKNPDCIIVYKSGELDSWWKTLPSSWKSFFSGEFKIDSPPTKEQLHRILFLDSIDIKNNNQLESLEPLQMISGLKKLYLSGTMISDLRPLAQLKELEVLRCNQSPVNELTPLSGLVKLESLDIENTPVADLEPIALLKELRKLNASGTQIKSIDPIQSLTKLEEIKLNNTLIKNLKPLIELPYLKAIECYNTKISAKTIEKFKEAKPGCKVVYY